jgi:hypothetical protein
MVSLSIPLSIPLSITLSIPLSIPHTLFPERQLYARLTGQNLSRSRWQKEQKLAYDSRKLRLRSGFICVLKIQLQLQLVLEFHA